MYSKKGIRALHLVWAPAALPRTSESTLSCKISSQNSFWKTTQLSKMLCKNDPLTVQRFSHNVLSPEFSGAVSSFSSLNTRFLFGKFLIFFYGFYLIRLFNSNPVSRVTLITFTALMISSTANWRVWPWQYVKWACDSISSLKTQS